MRQGQLNFSKGEISEELIARIDVPSYASALKRARNVIVLKYGGVSKRPGTHFVSIAYGQDDPVRLLPFQFSLTQAYVLEMGQAYMRPIANGGMVIEEQLKVTAITQAENAQVTAAYHAYNVGEQVYFLGITGMTEINGLTGTVLSVIDDSNFTIDIDTRLFSAFIDSDGDVRTEAPTPPPPPPPVVDPAPTPTPPRTTIGGGFCVTLDAMILMADGTEKLAGELQVGDLIHTRHEATLEWGNFPVSAMAVAPDEPLFKAVIGGKELRGTALHRIWVAGAWHTLSELGRSAGRGDVAKITVTDAHTYISNGILSHNIKPLQREVE